MNARCLLAVAFAGLTIPDAAWAYIGPGAGISAIGSLLAIIATLVFAIVGFVWFPVKRLMKRRKAKRAGSSGDVPPSGA